MPFGFKHTDSDQLDHRTPLKTTRLDDASTVRDISGETVTFQFDSGGSLASATGEAAGTLIYAKLAHDGVLDSFKESVGDYQNTSFVFTTGTVLTTLVQFPDERILAELVNKTTTERFTRVGEFLTTNGEYVIDHVNGAIWGVAAVVVADDTGAYSIKTPISTSGGVATDVNVKEVGGNATDTNTGVVGVGTQRVTLATDVALPTGTNIIGKTGGLSGAATNGTEALTPADTWVQVPGTAPTSDYVLVVSKENAAGTIRWSFENGGVPGVTNGNRMTSDDIVFTLAASEVVYFGSTTAGDDVNWATKII